MITSYEEIGTVRAGRDGGGHSSNAPEIHVTCQMCLRRGGRITVTSFCGECRELGRRDRAANLCTAILFSIIALGAAFLTGFNCKGF